PGPGARHGGAVPAGATRARRAGATDLRRFERSRAVRAARPGWRAPLAVRDARLRPVAPALRPGGERVVLRLERRRALPRGREHRRAALALHDERRRVAATRAES